KWSRRNIFPSPVGNLTEELSHFCQDLTFARTRQWPRREETQSGVEHLGILQDMLPRHFRKGLNLRIALLDPDNELAHGQIQLFDGCGLIGQAPRGQVTSKDLLHARFVDHKYGSRGGIHHSLWLAVHLSSMIQDHLKLVQRDLASFEPLAILVNGTIK